MIRNLFAALAAILVSSGVAAEAPRAIDGFGGIGFGAPPASVEGLVVASWKPSACACERVYYAAQPQRRARLGGVRLYWPGLLYRFFEDRLYAVEADFPADPRAFDGLLADLTARYGEPDTRQSWQSAPRDTYVHAHRLRSAGWFSTDGLRSVWLIGDDGGGSVTVIDNSLSEVRAAAIGRDLASRPPRRSPTAARSSRLAGR